jgi:acetoin:2,6-dichlorophenolindophenol oxidoreductase subunit beta
MARKISFRQAIIEALDQEMARDEKIIVMGEDVVGGAGTDMEDEAWGGPFGLTSGLYAKYGGNRIMDTPISESAFIGAAVGAASAGYRPVAELMFCDFLGVCFDQIYNQAAKFRYMFGGKATTPVVIRTAIGAGLRAAAQHSQSLHPIFTHVPGLKCVIPSSPYEVKGLLIAAIRDDDPVVFCEHKALFEMTGDVPEEPYAIPLGEANYVREGGDITIVTHGLMVSRAKEVAATLEADGIDCEIIDLRTTSPLDEETILESAENTGRVVVIDEATPRCNIAGDISSLVSEQLFGKLKAPVRRITAPHTPVPFSPALEDLWLPDNARIEQAIRDTVAYAGK